MVSFYFGKRSGKKRPGNRPGYSYKTYMSKMQELPPGVRGGLDFGKRRKSRKSACRGLKKSSCAGPMCGWRKGKGCRNKRNAPSAVISGDDDIGAYADAAGIHMFGRRRYRRRRSSFGRRRSMIGEKPKRSCTAIGRRRRRRCNMVGRRSGMGKRSRKVGSRRKSRKVGRKGRKANKKLPASIRRMCRKYKIKCTKKVGSRKVYKKLSIVKRQIAKRRRSMKKAMKRMNRRRSSFGAKRRGRRRGRKGSRRSTRRKVRRTRRKGRKSRRTTVYRRRR